MKAALPLHIRKHIHECIYALFSRRLVCASIFNLVGMLCVRYDAHAFLIVFLGISAVCFIYNFKYAGLRLYTESFIFSTVFLIIGASVMYRFETDELKLKRDEELCLSGTVVESYENMYSTEYVVDMGSFYDRVIVYDDTKSAYKIGSIIEVRGVVSDFDKASNMGQFDVENYYKCKNIVAKMEDAEVKCLSETEFHVKDGLRTFREYIGAKIVKYCSRNGGILKGILTGDKTDISEYESELYQRSGISHILAVSGLHVSHISMIISLLLGVSKLPRKLTMILSAVILVAFSVFSGFSSSVFRALMMYLFSSIAFIKGYRNDIPTALAVSHLVYSLLYPYGAFSAGTVLSYMAVICIYIFSKFYKKVHIFKEADRMRQIFKDRVYKPLALGLFLSFSSFPLVIYYFYTYPLLSVFVNMYVIFMMPALFITGIMACVMAFVYEPIGSLLFKIPDMIISSFTEISSFTTEKLDTVMVAGKPDIYKIIIYYILLFLVLLGFSYVKRKYVLMILMLIPMLILIYRPDYNVLTMLDVDQGECIHISSSDGINVLVDCGSLGVSEVFSDRIEPYLLAEGVDCLDYVFLSHADNDHINGIVQYYNKQIKLVDIKNMVMTHAMYADTEVYENIVKPALSYGTNVLLIGKGDSVNCSSFKLECLYPDSVIKSDDNNLDSMVLLLKGTKSTVLFTGDLPESQESEIWFHRADILKVSHHGSKTATSEELLRKINAKIAIISCGKDNSYGHPSETVLKNLKKYNIHYYITAESGQLRYNLD